MKRWTSMVLAVLLVLALAGCGGSGDSASSAEQFDLDSYKESVNESRTLIYDTASILGNIANYEKTLGNYQGKMSATMIDGGYEFAEEKGGVTKEDIDNAHASIREQYKTISIIETEGNEAQQLRDAYVEMYEAYADLYNLVTAPSGSVSSFSSSAAGYIKTISSAADTLSLFLD